MFFSSDPTEALGFRRMALNCRHNEINFSESMARQLKSESEAWLGILCLESDIEVTQNLLDAAVTMLRTITEEGWKAAIEAKSDIVRLAIQVHTRASTFQLGRPLKIAIQELIGPPILIGSEEVAETIEKLLVILEPIFKQGLADAIYENNSQLAGNEYPYYWRLAGPLILESIDRNGGAQQSRAGRSILIPIIKRGDTDGLNWLLEVLGERGAINALTNDEVALYELAHDVAAVFQDESIGIPIREKIGNLISYLPSNLLATDQSKSTDSK